MACNICSSSFHKRLLIFISRKCKPRLWKGSNILSLLCNIKIIFFVKSAWQNSCYKIKDNGIVTSYRTTKSEKNRNDFLLTLLVKQNEVCASLIFLVFSKQHFESVKLLLWKMLVEMLISKSSSHHTLSIKLIKQVLYRNQDNYLLVRITEILFKNRLTLFKVNHWQQHNQFSMFKH